MNKEKGTQLSAQEHTISTSHLYAHRALLHKFVLDYSSTFMNCSLPENTQSISQTLKDPRSKMPSRAQKGEVLRRGLK